MYKITGKKIEDDTNGSSSDSLGDVGANANTSGDNVMKRNEKGGCFTKRSVGKTGSDASYKNEPSEKTQSGNIWNNVTVPGGGIVASTGATKSNDNKKTDNSAVAYPEDDYVSRLNKLADGILNGKGFSYDRTRDDSYLSYLKSYRENGIESAKNSLASLSKMSAGYGNSYAYKGAQNSYEQYMAKASDKIPELYNDAYSRYRDDISDMRDSYYKDRDYYHTLEREKIADDRYASEYSDKLKQQGIENDLNERKFFESVIRGDFEDDLNERKYQSDLEQKKVENDLAQRKLDDQIAQEIAESYRYEKDNEMKERQWKYDYDLEYAKLEETKRQNNSDNEYRNKVLANNIANDERDYKLSKQKAQTADEQWESEFNEKVREFDENMIYKKYFS